MSVSWQNQRQFYFSYKIQITFSNVTKYTIHEVYFKYVF